MAERIKKEAQKREFLVVQFNEPYNLSDNSRGLFYIDSLTNAVYYINNKNIFSMVKDSSGRISAMVNNGNFTSIGKSSTQQVSSGRDVQRVIEEKLSNGTEQYWLLEGNRTEAISKQEYEDIVFEPEQTPTPEPNPASVQTPTPEAEPSPRADGVVGKFSILNLPSSPNTNYYYDNNRKKAYFIDKNSKKFCEDKFFKISDAIMTGNSARLENAGGQAVLVEELKNKGENYILVDRSRNTCREITPTEYSNLRTPPSTTAPQSTPPPTTSTEVKVGDKTYIVDFKNRSVTNKSDSADTLDFENLLYDLKDNEELSKAVEKFNNTHSTGKIDHKAIIEKIGKNRATNKSKNEGKKNEKDKKEEKKPDKAKRQKAVETISTIATGISAFAVLTSVFVPWLAVAGIALGATSLGTYTFSNLFKYDPYIYGRDRVKKERKNEALEREYKEKFIANEKDLDATLSLAEAERDKLVELCNEPNSSASLFKELFDEYGMSYPTFDYPDGKIDFERFCDVNDQGLLTFRQNITSQLKEIASANGSDRSKLIDAFISQNFDNVPSSERDRCAKIFADDIELNKLISSLDNINTLSQKRHDMVMEQSNYISGVSLEVPKKYRQAFGLNYTKREEWNGRKMVTTYEQKDDNTKKRFLFRLRRVLNEQENEGDKLNLLHRYADTIVNEIACYPNGMQTLTRDIVDMFGENGTKAFEILTTAQKRLGFILNEKVTSISQRILDGSSTRQIALDYFKLLDASQKLPTESKSQLDVMNDYTRGIYHQGYYYDESIIESQLNEIEKNPTDLTNDEIELLSTLQNSISPLSSTQQGFVALNNDMRECKTTDSITALTSTGMLSSIFPTPKVTDTRFDPNKSIFNMAKAISQTELQLFDSKYLIKNKKRNHNAYVVKKDAPKLNLGKEKSRLLITRRDRHLTLVKDTQLLNDQIIKEGEQNVVQLMDITSKILEIGGILVPENGVGITSQKGMIKASPVGKNLTEEQAESVAKAMVMAQEQQKTFSAQPDSAKTPLYTHALKIMNMALNGNLSNLRVANAFDDALGLAHEDVIYTPAQACGQSAEQRDFEGQLNKFLASLPLEAQSRLKVEISSLTNPSASEKCEVIREALGEMVIGTSGMTINEYIERSTLQTADGQRILDEEMSNSILATLKENEKFKSNALATTIDDQTDGVTYHGVAKARINDRADELTGKKLDEYEDAIDWIVKTQHIRRERANAVYKEVCALNPDTNKHVVIRKKLFKALDLSEKVEEEFKDYQSRGLIKDVSMIGLANKKLTPEMKKEKKISLMEANLVRYRSTSQKFLEKFANADSEQEKIDLIKFLCNPANRDFVAKTFGNDYLTSLSSLPEIDEANISEIYHNLIQKQNSTINLEGGVITGQIKKTIEEKLDEMAGDIISLEMDEAEEVNTESLELAKRSKQFDDHSRLFCIAYSNFLENPTDPKTQRRLQTFINAPQYADFFKSTGISTNIIEALIKDCQGQLEIAPKKVKNFEESYGLYGAVNLTRRHFEEEKRYLAQKQTAKSQEELDECELDHKAQLLDYSLPFLKEKINHIDKANDNKFILTKRTIEYYQQLALINELKQKIEKFNTEIQYLDETEFGREQKESYNSEILGANNQIQSAEKMIEKIKKELQGRFPLSCFNTTFDAQLIEILGISSNELKNVAEQDQYSKINTYVKKLEEKAKNKREKLSNKSDKKREHLDKQKIQTPPTMKETARRVSNLGKMFDTFSSYRDDRDITANRQQEIDSNLEHRHENASKTPSADHSDNEREERT